MARWSVALHSVYYLVGADDNGDAIIVDGTRPGTTTCVSTDIVHCAQSSHLPGKVVLAAAISQTFYYVEQSCLMLSRCTECCSWLYVHRLEMWLPFSPTNVYFWERSTLWAEVRAVVGADRWFDAQVAQRNPDLRSTWALGRAEVAVGRYLWTPASSREPAQLLNAHRLNSTATHCGA